MPTPIHRPRRVRSSAARTGPTSSGRRGSSSARCSWRRCSPARIHWPTTPPTAAASSSAWRCGSSASHRGEPADRRHRRPHRPLQVAAADHELLPVLRPRPGCSLLPAGRNPGVGLPAAAGHGGHGQGLTQVTSPIRSPLRSTRADELSHLHGHGRVRPRHRYRSARLGAMDKVWVRRFSSHEEAERAECEFWAQMTGDQRIEALEEMRRDAWKVTGERLEGLRRTVRIVVVDRASD